MKFSSLISLFSLTLTNVLERLELAELYQMKSLYSSCVQMIRRNLSMVETNAKWFELKTKSPELAFSVLEEFAEDIEGLQFTPSIFDCKFKNSEVWLISKSKIINISHICRDSFC
jgi:hypothetical protein